LISVEDLFRAQSELLPDTAGSSLPVLAREFKKPPTLRGRTFTDLFWKASTRTSSSFDLAAAERPSAVRPSARRLGTEVAQGLPSVPLPGVGGVMGGPDALESTACGATAVGVGATDFNGIEAPVRSVRSPRQNPS
jgi:hypothetical protein